MKMKKKLSENILDKFSIDFLRNQVLKNAYGNDDTVIARLDPRILLVWYLFFGLVPWFVNNLWFLMACFLLVLITTVLARVAGLVLLLFAVGVFTQTGYLLVVSFLFGGDASTIVPLLILTLKVATISLAADGSRNEVPVYQMLEDFKNHPAVAPIIRGAKMVEHSGHMVPEGGYGMIPRYVFDGCLIAGETAGLCMNMGYQVRGMDFAVASGRMAAEAAVAAIDAGDTSAAGLAPYKAAMEGSFVIQDLRTFSKWPHVMEEWGSMFTDYPVMVKEVFNAMFSVDGAPQRPLMKRMRPIIKKRGALKLGREVMKAVKAL